LPYKNNSCVCRWRSKRGPYPSSSSNSATSVCCSPTQRCVLLRRRPSPPARLLRRLGTRGMGVSPSTQVRTSQLVLLGRGNNNNQHNNQQLLLYSKQQSKSVEQPGVSQKKSVSA